MSKVAHQSDPVMLNEQSFEQFGSDQVAYKIWCSEAGHGGVGGVRSRDERPRPSGRPPAEG